VTFLIVFSCAIEHTFRLLLLLSYLIGKPSIRVKISNLRANRHYLAVSTLNVSILNNDNRSVDIAY
jgi:hypothetical protein